MANEITKILNAITPQQYNEYMQQYTAAKSAFVQSGIAVSDERVSKNITSGGLLVNMPFWNDLTGDSEVLGNGDKALETGKITAGADIACVLYRGRGWAANELTGIVAGSDPVRAYWLREDQKALIATLNGIFATGTGGEKGALEETHVSDQSKASTGIDAAMVLDAKQLLGDSADQVTTIAMH